LGKARRRRSKAGIAALQAELASPAAASAPQACGAPAAAADEALVTDDAQSSGAAAWDGDWEDVGSEGSGPPSAAGAGGGGAGVSISLPADGGQPATTPKAPRRTAFTKEDREAARLVHRAHLLCLLARGLLYDAAADDPTLLAVLLSLTPPDVADLLSGAAGCAPAGLSAAMAWFRREFRLAPGGALQPPTRGEDELAAAVARARGAEGVAQQLREAVERRCGDAETLAALFAAALRAHGVRARTVRLLEPSSLKPGGEGGGVSSVMCLTEPRWILTFDPRVFCRRGVLLVVAKTA
jgi:hypothetical protein